MIIFGKDAQTNTPLSVSLEQLHTGCYILGLPGTGKSTLLQSLASSLMQYDESVIVIDPKGDLVDGIIKTMPEKAVKNTYLLDVTDHDWPFSLNVFSYPDPKNISHKDRAAIPNRIYKAFVKRWPEVENGRYFKNILLAIIPVLLEHPQFSLLHVRKFIRDEHFRKAILKDITDTEALDFWDEFDDWSPSDQKRERKPFLDRMNELFRDPYVKYIICQKQGLVDFRQAIIQKKHFLIKLPILDDAFAYAGRTIGIFLLLQIFGALFSFASIQEHKRPKFTLIMDEFSQFAFGGEEFSQMINFGRGLGIRLIMAHQTREQLKTDESLKPIVGITKGASTVVCLKLNPIDAKDMADTYPGLTRRPTDIYIDVLDRLETHSQAKVKEFYWHSVTKLQQAAKQTEREYTRYTFDFGYGEIEYKPSLAKNCMRLLNDLLYYTQKEQRIDEKRLASFVREYAKLSGLMECVKARMESEAAKKRYSFVVSEIERLGSSIRRLKSLDFGDVATAQEKQQIEELKEKFSLIEKTCQVGDALSVLVLLQLQRGKGRVDSKNNKRGDCNFDGYKVVLDNGNVSQRKTEWGERSLGSAVRNISLRDYYSGEGKLVFYEKRQRRDGVVEEVEVSNPGLWVLKERDVSNPEYLYFSAWDIVNPVFVLEKIWNGKLAKSIFKKFIWEFGEDNDEWEGGSNMMQLCNDFQELKKKYEALGLTWDTLRRQGKSEESERYKAEGKVLREKKTEPLQRLEAQERSLVAEEKDLATRDVDVWKISRERIERTIRDVLVYLIAEPIAADKAALSGTEIETMLQTIPLYHAYVNSNSVVSMIKTASLPGNLPWPDFRKRKDQIAAQTKRKYAPKGRATIEKELAAIFQDMTRDRIEDEAAVSLKPANKTKSATRPDEDDDIIE